jgi:branched-subunit amino acid aminotransferase/4-amino-4-deoxychorismate lyase
MMVWIYLNDRFVKEDQAQVSVFDHGFLYGDGVYETIRSYGEKIFMRDQHLARLRRSADGIGLTIPKRDWPSLLHESMERNSVGNDHFARHGRHWLGSGAVSHAHGRDHDQTAQAPSPRALSDRREPRRGPNETQPPQRA